MTQSLSDAGARDLVGRQPHWYHRIDVRPGLVTPGINDSPLHLHV